MPQQPLVTPPATTPQTLAQTIKAKYPGQYDDISDTDLEAKVKAKYPGVYDDLPVTKAQTPPPMPGIASQLLNTGLNTLGEAAKATVQPVIHPLDFLASSVQMPANVIKSHMEQGQKAYDAFMRGDRTEAVLRELAAIVPVVGPITANYVDANQQGKEQIAGQGIASLLMSKAPEAVAATRAGVATARNAVASRVMQSALKPSVEASMDTTAAGVPKVVDTMLKEGITVSPEGVKKLYTFLGNTAKSIETKTANAPGRVFPDQVVQHALDLTKGFADQVNSAQDLKAVADAANQFLDEQTAKHGVAFGLVNPMTVADAQALKTGTYKALGSKSYGELKGASIEGQKGLASGLKDQIEQLVPDIKDTNARYGALSDALEATARRVGVSGNRDLGGIFWIAHNPEAFLAATFDRSPMVKSLIARGLYTEAATAAQVPPPLLKFAINALVSAPTAMKPVPSHEVKK
jgi:hypothetical protein